MSQREDKVKVESKTATNQSRQQYPGGPADILNSWCNMWGNLLIGLGESISSPNCVVPTARSTNQPNDTAQQSNAGNCALAEFSVGWCGPGKSNGPKTESEDTTEVSGKYQDQSRQAKIDISTGSNN